jgi:hypothetical protein
MSLPICCSQDIRSRYPNAITIQVNPDQKQQGRHNFGPGRQGGGRWVVCRDLSVPGRPSDCPANAHYCFDYLWFSVMSQQCLGTCKNLCNQLRGNSFTGNGLQPFHQQGRSRYGVRHLGGGRGKNIIFYNL